MIVRYSNNYSKSRSAYLKLIQKINLIIFGAFFALMIISLYIFKNNSSMSMQALVALSISYVMWALVHHYLDKTLTLEIVIEYVLIASLVLIILSSILVI